MKLRTFASTLATAAALTLATPAWAGYVFSFSAAPNPVFVGDTVTVDVTMVNDVAGTNYLSFDLLFNPAVLAFQSATGVGFFSNEFFFAFDSGPGVISTLVSDDLLDTTLADGTVGRFTFEAMADGTSSLNIDYMTAYITDGNGADHGVDRNDGLVWIDDITSNTGSLNVEPRVTNSVPVPGTLLLAGLGLALLGGTRWRGSPLPAAR